MPKQKTVKSGRYSRYLNQYSELLSYLSNQGNSIDLSLRNEAIQEFNKTGFPTSLRGNEAWKFTNVNPIANHDFEFSFKENHHEISSEILQSIAPWSDDWDTITFVNGQFCQQLSKNQNPKIVIKNIASDKTHSSLGKHADFKTNGFIAANTAFLNQGAEVILPKNYEAKTPINIVNVSVCQNPALVVYPRTLIIMEPNSSASIIESYVSTNTDTQFTNAVSEISVERGSKLYHHRLLLENSSTFHIGSTVVDQKQDSFFQTISYSEGAKVARNDLLVRLNEPGARCDVRGLYFTEQNRHIDNHIDVDHASHHTYSKQHFKGILADKSRAVFSGRTLIQQHAQKSEALQSDKNLILSKGARVNTKPSLEIYADDIQAAHGATAGAIPDDQIMYMLARGLDMETATSFLIQGFANEIIDSISLEGFKQYLLNHFESSMPKFRFQGFGKGKVFGGPADRV